jgi:hypothetical protein
MRVSLPSPNLNISWVKYRHLKGLTKEGESRESRGAAGSSSPWPPPTLCAFVSKSNHGKECKSSLTQIEDQIRPTKCNKKGLNSIIATIPFIGK